MHGKPCVKCGAAIPADDVRLAHDVDERCHDCADFCDEPGCRRCAARTVTMTNDSILKTPDALLGALDKQRKALLNLALLRRPCPVCGAYANLIEAAGIALNDYAFGHESIACRCGRCDAELEQIVPLFGGQGWFWKRKGTGE